jgi:hypothetical protein
MIVFGNAFYGKVDVVPGLFHVKTYFFHLWWLPIAPVNSYLFVEGGNGVGAKVIDLRWKSILTAWFRTLLGFCIFPCVLVGVVELNPQPAIQEIATAWGVAFALALIYLMTFRWTRAGYSRALELARMAGIDPEAVRACFGRDPHDPDPFANEEHS